LHDKLKFDINNFKRKAFYLYFITEHHETIVGTPALFPGKSKNRILVLRSANPTKILHDYQSAVREMQG
jgi:hypothetical protein